MCHALMLGICNNIWPLYCEVYAIKLESVAGSFGCCAVIRMNWSAATALKREAKGTVLNKTRLGARGLDIGLEATAL